jgi:hypothetical protein
MDEHAFAAVLVPPSVLLQPQVNVFTPLVTAVPVPELQSAAPDGAMIEAGGVPQTALVPVPTILSVAELTVPVMIESVSYALSIQVPLICGVVSAAKVAKRLVGAPPAVEVAYEPGVNVPPAPVACENMSAPGVAGSTKV